MRAPVAKGESQTKTTWSVAMMSSFATVTCFVATAVLLDFATAKLKKKMSVVELSIASAYFISLAHSISSTGFTPNKKCQTLAFATIAIDRRHLHNRCNQPMQPNEANIATEHANCRNRMSGNFQIMNLPYFLSLQMISVFYYLSKIAFSSKMETST
jgi:hypothetical protein